MMNLELFVGLSGLPFLFILLLLPESPRWLLVNDKMEEGVRVVKKFCRYNKRPFSDNRVKVRYMEIIIFLK